MHTCYCAESNLKTTIGGHKLAVSTVMQAPTCVLQGTNTTSGITSQVVQPTSGSGSTSAAAKAKSIALRSALAGIRHSGATYLNYSGQLHGMLTNSSRAYQAPGK